MSTTIKRLQQNGEYFVPITLAEAVVVNGEHIWGEKEITTLDAVLRILYGSNDNLNQTLESINQELANKQDQLIPGNGISITFNSEGKPVIESSLSLYQIVSTLPEKPNATYENKIYLVGTEAGKMVEYICVNKNGNYYWEQLGVIQVTEDVDLSRYVTTETFAGVTGGLDSRLQTVEGKITTIENTISNIQGSMLTAVDVTDSKGNKISVNYEIPNTLYDTAIETDHIV